MKRWNILVTGGAGYIGSHTVRQLCDHPSVNQVIVLDDLSTGFQEAVDPRARFVCGSVHDDERVAAVIAEFQVTAIIHFAAKLIVPESVAQPLMYYENNVGGVIHLANMCRRFQVPYFIFSSTAAVYGNPDHPERLINEEAPIRPLNPYGWSKWMSEQVLKDCYQAFGLRTVVLRYFNVAGAGPNNGQRTKNATHLIKVAAEAACGKRPFVEVFGQDYPTPDGTGVRDYIHVEDLAAAHVLALDHLMRGQVTFEVFNCGYGHGFSVLEVLKTMQKVSHQSFDIRMGPRRPGDASALVADPSKLRTTLGWRPQFDDLEVICRSAYMWEKQLK